MWTFYSPEKVSLDSSAGKRIGVSSVVGGNLMAYFLSSFHKCEHEREFEKKEGKEGREMDLDWKSRFRSEEDP